jgi:hypothetical protein
MAVTIKKVVIWDVMLCGSCNSGRSTETSAVTRATRRYIQNDIFQSKHCLTKTAAAENDPFSNVRS